MHEYRAGKMKIRRFHADENRTPFDRVFLEVDRVLNASEFFSVTHPHQATLVENTWK